MPLLKHTPGPWKVGKGYCVVSESPEGLTINGSTDERSKEYYGGYLIGESISANNAPLISAAPDLLDALMSIENDNNSIPEAIWELRNQAIRKALNTK